MDSIKEKYPSVSSVILPQIESLLLHNDAQYLLQLGDLELTSFKMNSLFYCYWLIEQATKNIKPDIYVNYEALPFYSDSVDAILTSYSPFYKKNSRSAIEECMRILKPNGYLCILGILPYSNTTYPKETKRDSLSRLYKAHVLCRNIQRAQGIIIESKHYFDHTLDSNHHTYQFFKKWMPWATLLWPHEQHYYCIIAQKRSEPFKLIPLSETTIPFPTIKKNAYVKS